MACSGDIMLSLTAYRVPFQLERTRTLLLFPSKRVMKTGFKLNHMQVLQPKLRHVCTLTIHPPWSRFMHDNSWGVEMANNSPLDTNKS